MTHPDTTVARVTRFAVTARVCPQLLGRLVGLLAQQGLIPVSVSASRCDDLLLVSIVQDGLDDHRAAVIEGKMRAIVTVLSVGLS